MTQITRKKDYGAAFSEDYEMEAREAGQRLKPHVAGEARQRACTKALAKPSPACSRNLINIFLFGRKFLTHSAMMQCQIINSANKH